MLASELLGRVNKAQTVSYSLSYGGQLASHRKSENSAPVSKMAGAASSKDDNIMTNKQTLSNWMDDTLYYSRSVEDENGQASYRQMIIKHTMTLESIYFGDTKKKGKKVNISSIEEGMDIADEWLIYDTDLEAGERVIKESKHKRVEKPVVHKRVEAPITDEELEQVKKVYNPQMDKLEVEVEEVPTPKVTTPTIPDKKEMPHEKYMLRTQDEINNFYGYCTFCGGDIEGHGTKTLVRCYMRNKDRDLSTVPYPVKAVA